jgi:hypothetical protein
VWGRGYVLRDPIVTPGTITPGASVQNSAAPRGTAAA